MTDKFTLRDFLVYFTTGSLSVISLSILFFKPLFDETSLFLANHMYIKEFSSLLIVLLIPLLYFIGHIIHGIDPYRSMELVLPIDGKDPCRSPSNAQSSSRNGSSSSSRSEGAITVPPKTRVASLTCPAVVVYRELIWTRARIRAPSTRAASPASPAVAW